jgi:hypothetical protein
MNMYEGAADKACKDYARMFFGGKECLHMNEEITSYTALMEVLNGIQIANDSMKTRKVMEAKNCPKTRIPISYNSDPGFKTKNGMLDTPYNDGVIIDKFDFKKAKSEVKILADLLDGKWITHSEIFGIATNLVHIEGGMKLMTDAMTAANKADTAFYSNNNFGAVRYANYKKYTPQRLENFSPYAEDAVHLNIINAVRTLQGEVVQTKSITNMTLSQAESLFQTGFDKAIADTRENRVYLFKVHTALGKTRMLENLQGVTIAEPTHKLKDEVSDRMSVTHLTTPKLPEFEDFVSNKLNFYYKVGLISKASGLLHDIADNKKGYYNLEDIEAAKEYIKANRICYTTDDTVITTHQKAMFSSFKSDTLIFDEDPLQAVLKLNQITIGDLINIEGKTVDAEKKNEVSAIVDDLRALGAGKVIETPLYAIDIDVLSETIADSTLDSNLLDFLNSDYILRDVNNKNIIHYINRRDIPQTDKLFVMSATASEHIYRALYGDRLEVIDIMDVEQEGSVIQNTKRSYSRQQLSVNSTDIVKIVGDLPVITFMTYKALFNNPVQGMHFGNCAGYDSLNGQDIAVVGTPHLSNIVYVLYAKALGFKIKPNDMLMRYQMIEYSGFKFKFMTYDNLALRNIQLGLIESDLIQAVGRARTLRTNATVHLYSTLPLRQTTEFKR